MGKNKLLVLISAVLWFPTFIGLDIVWFERTSPFAQFSIGFLALTGLLFTMWLLIQARS